MVYTAGTDDGSSGAPILKVSGQKLFCVAIHRGGHENNWDGDDTKGYNFGSRFAEIYKSIRSSLHPPGQLLAYVAKYSRDALSSQFSWHK